MGELRFRHVRSTVCFNAGGTLVVICFVQIVSPMEQRLPDHWADTRIIVSRPAPHAFANQVLLPSAFSTSNFRPPIYLPHIIRGPPPPIEPAIPLKPSIRILPVVLWWWWRQRGRGRWYGGGKCTSKCGAYRRERERERER